MVLPCFLTCALSCFILRPIKIIFLLSFFHPKMDVSENSDKRGLQNFASLHKNLTSDMWGILWNGSMERKSDALCEYAFQVGLRCPDNRSLLVMCALLHLDCGKNIDRCTLYLRTRELADKFKKYRERYEKIYGRLVCPDPCLEAMTCPDAVPCQVEERDFLEVVDRIRGRSTNGCIAAKSNVGNTSGEGRMLDLLMRLHSLPSGGHAFHGFGASAMQYFNDQWCFDANIGSSFHAWFDSHSVPCICAQHFAKFSGDSCD